MTHCDRYAHNCGSAVGSACAIPIKETPMTRPRTWLFICVAVCVVCAACGSSGTDTPATAKGDASSLTDTGSPTGDASAADAATDATGLVDTTSSDTASPAIAIKDLCPLLVGAQCAALSACGCPTDAAGLAGCTAKQSDSCEKSIVAFAGGVSLGALAYQPNNAAACLGAFKDLSSSCATPTNRNRPAACGNLFVDVAALGGTCSAYSAGLACADSKGACDPQNGNKCVPLPAAGAPCLMQRCGADLVCDAGTCHKLAAMGGACATDDGCALPQVCLGGVCAVGLPAGATCTATTQCGSGLACLGGACSKGKNSGDVCGGDVCGADLMCVQQQALPICRPLAKASETCAGPETCEAGLYCDYMVMPATCKVTPQLGDKCPTGVCSGDLACNAQQLCVVPPQPGEPCLLGASKGCVAGYGCDANLKCAAFPVGGNACIDNQCAGGASCDFMQLPAMCVAAAAEGQPCSQSPGACQAGLGCDQIANVCKKLVAVNGPCQVAPQCAAGLYCQHPSQQVPDGTCQPLITTPGAACPEPSWASCGPGLRCAQADGVCAKGICAMLN